MTSFRHTNDAHRDCWELLPWVANERIDPRDLRRIEPHLHSCTACQAELVAQSRLRQLIRADEPVVIAPQASLQKLLQRLAAEQTHITPSATQRGGERRMPASAPRWLAVAAAMQAIVIVALLWALWLQSQALLTAPRYTTLTSPASLPPHPAVHVVFRNEVTIGEITSILRNLDARIVAGPNIGGVYTIQSAKSEPTASQIASLLAGLRQDERVLLSEPVEGTAAR
ncbi:MAG: hypothetical protein C0P74_005735 [Gammaproteobacteria bacterium]|nr:hypothetical protein [Gammaproteobacteria bacterium]